MNQPLAYQNGQFLPASQLSIPVYDAGFVWGATVTDRARTFNGRLFRLDEHLHRFRRSCELARVPLMPSYEELRIASERLVAENLGDGELSIIWIATPGPLPAFAAMEPTKPLVPTLIAYSCPIDLIRFAQRQTNGVSLVSLPKIVAIDPHIKHRSRLAWWIAQQQVRDRDPDAEPLLLDLLRDYVLETPTSNVLAAFEHELVSPLAVDVLDGVSLGVVQELCSRLGISFRRRNIGYEEFSQASEILLTNTTDCVVGVSKLDGLSIPFPGRIRTRLMDAWSELVGVDLRVIAGSF